jgi:GAF domain-containing protein
MISAGGILGALSVQSREAEAFDQDDIIVLQGIADSLASALEIASLFQQVNKSMDEISSLHQQYLDKEWSEVSKRYKTLSFTYEGEKTESLYSESTVSQEQQKETVIVPINLRDQLIGNISLETDNSTLTSEEQALIESVTTQTALALENVRLLQTTQRNAEYNRSITDITGKVWESADIDSIMRTAIREIGHKLNASDGFIHLEIPE